MGLSKSYLPWPACVATGGIGIPALASGETRAPGQIGAYGFGFRNPVTGERSSHARRSP